MTVTEIIVPALHSLITAATAALFVTAGIGKAIDFTVVRAWCAQHVPATAATAAATTLIAFDATVASVLLATATIGGLTHLFPVSVLALLLLMRLFPNIRQTCPCFGRASQRDGRTANRVMVALLFANLVAAFQRPIPYVPTLAWMIGAAVVGTAGTVWLLTRPTVTSLPIESGLLTAEQIREFLATVGTGASALPEKTIIVAGHGSCSSCSIVAAALVSMARLMPQQWSRFLDFPTRMHGSRVAVSGVLVATMSASMRAALQIRSVPTVSIIDSAGRFITYQGYEKCQRAITELIAAIPTQPNFRQAEDR